MEVGGTAADDLDPSGFAVEMDAGLTLIDAGIRKLIGLADSPELALQQGSVIMDWTQRLERVANLLPVLGQFYVRAMDQMGCATDSPLGIFSGTDKFLAALLHIPRPEAKRRVLAAEMLTPAVAPSGPPKEAHFPALAELQQSGDVSPDSMAMALRELTGWERLVGHRDTVTRACEPGRAADQRTTPDLRGPRSPAGARPGR